MDGKSPSGFVSQSIRFFCTFPDYRFCRLNRGVVISCGCLTSSYRFAVQVKITSEAIDYPALILIVYATWLDLGQSGCQDLTCRIFSSFGSTIPSAPVAFIPMCIPFNGGPLKARHSISVAFNTDRYHGERRDDDNGI